MKQPVSFDNLDAFAKQCLNADHYPDAHHIFTFLNCPSCNKSEFKITIEHHTGSVEWDFKGIIRGLCSSCGYYGSLFTITGGHRKVLRKENSVCECGNNIFSVGKCERIENIKVIPGIFNEVVIVGKCCSCNRNKIFAYTY